jgi:hypothetical protein
LHEIGGDGKRSRAMTAFASNHFYLRLYLAKSETPVFDF